VPSSASRGRSQKASLPWGEGLREGGAIIRGDWMEASLLARSSADPSILLRPFDRLKARLRMNGIGGAGERKGVKSAFDS